MTIRAVCFDVDETLVDFDLAARAAHIELFGDADGYPLWCDLTPEFWPLFTEGDLSFDDMRAARMGRYLELVEHAERDGVAMEAQRWELVERSFRTYDDVAPTLTALRADGYRLGVVTNNESVHQRRKLSTVGLADAFDAVVISGEVGVAKPDPAIFRRACADLGVAPGETLHVGDLLDVDARAAAAAGLTGVWLDRHAAHDGAPLDVVRIERLDQLPTLLS